MTTLADLEAELAQEHAASAIQVARSLEYIQVLTADRDRAVVERNAALHRLQAVRNIVLAP